MVFFMADGWLSGESPDAVPAADLGMTRSFDIRAYWPNIFDLPYNYGTMEVALTKKRKINAVL